MDSPFRKGRAVSGLGHRVQRRGARCGRWRRLIGAVLLSLACGASDCDAAGGDGATEPPEASAATVPAPPEVMRNKPPIPEFLLKDKREGTYFTGLPLIAVTPESGVVYGGTVQWYDNGSKDSPFFS